MFCSNCSNTLPQDARFCNRCGASLTAAGETPAADDAVLPGISPSPAASAVGDEASPPGNNLSPAPQATSHPQTDVVSDFIFVAMNDLPQDPDPPSHTGQEFNGGRIPTPSSATGAGASPPPPINFPAGVGEEPLSIPGGPPPVSPWGTPSSITTPHTAGVGEQPKPKRKRTAVLALVALLVAGGGAVYATGAYEHLPFVNTSAADPPATEELAPLPDGIALLDPGSIAAPAFSDYTGAAAGVTRDEQPASDEAREPPARRTATAWGAASTDAWFDFPHANEYYMRAQRDEEHIYFLQPVDGKYGGHNLLRMSSDGRDPVILNNFANGREDLSAFTLLDDMIYFAVPLDDERSGYYRAPKSGGDAEFLFVQETSFMLTYQGDIYLMFPRQRSVGVYTPGRDTLPRLTLLIEWDDMANSDPPWLHSAFSVYNGSLYYAHSWEDATEFWRYDLDRSEWELLLAGVYGYLAQSYIHNGVYDGDTCYYAQIELDWDSGQELGYLRSAPLLAREGECTLLFGPLDPANFYGFIVRTGDQVIVQYDERYLALPLRGGNTEEVYLTYSEPFAVCGDFLFFKNEVANIRTREGFYSSAPSAGPSISVVDATRQARELAERYPDRLSIAP